MKKKRNSKERNSAFGDGIEWEVFGRACTCRHVLGRFALAEHSAVPESCFGRWVGGDRRVVPRIFEKEGSRAVHEEREKKTCCHPTDRQNFVCSARQGRGESDRECLDAGVWLQREPRGRAGGAPVDKKGGGGSPSYTTWAFFFFLSFLSSAG